MGIVLGKSRTNLFCSCKSWKLYTLLTSLHSRWPLLNLDLELGYVLLIRRLKQNNFFLGFQSLRILHPPPPQKKKKKKRKTNKQIKSKASCLCLGCSRKLFCNHSNLPLPCQRDRGLRFCPFLSVALMLLTARLDLQIKFKTNLTTDSYEFDKWP